MKHRHLVVLALSVALLLSLMAASLATAQVSWPGGIYTQNFDTLANTGTSSVVPAGWAFLETDTNADTFYTAGTGSSNAGDTYSFGASGNAERAFGGLRSNTLVPTIGVQFQNQTGVTVGRLAITYNCEQWRIGVTNRGAADRLNFEYSTNATSLTSGTWTAFTTLDCSSTVTSGPVGARDGNLDRTSVSGTVTGLNITSGSTFWLRWTDFNISGSDDGLAIDDFTLQFQTPTVITLREVKAAPSSLPIIWPMLGFSILLLSAVILRRRSRTT